MAFVGAAAGWFRAKRRGRAGASRPHPKSIPPGNVPPPLEISGQVHGVPGLVSELTEALPGQERAPGNRESTRENAQPWPPWLQWPPQAPAAGPGHAHLGPGSPQVNAFCAHQGPQAADPFTGRGGSSSVGPRSHPTQSLLSKFSPDFREYKRLGADLPPRGRVGPFEPRKTLSPPGRSQARDPPGDRVPGRGSRLPGPAPPGPEPWPAPVPGPRSLVLPWHSASGGVGDGLASGVHGKRIGPLGGGESSQFHGHDPRDPVKQA